MAFFIIIENISLVTVVADVPGTEHGEGSNVAQNGFYELFLLLAFSLLSALCFRLIVTFKILCCKPSYNLIRFSNFSYLSYPPITR